MKDYTELLEWLDRESEMSKKGLRLLTNHCSEAAAAIRELQKDLDCWCGISGCRNMQRMCRACLEASCMALQERVKDLELDAQLDKDGFFG